jgi:hypothetical protein
MAAELTGRFVAMKRFLSLMIARYFPAAKGLAEFAIGERPDIPVMGQTLPEGFKHDLTRLPVSPRIALSSHAILLTCISIHGMKIWRLVHLASFDLFLQSSRILLRISVPFTH